MRDSLAQHQLAVLAIALAVLLLLLPWWAPLIPRGGTPETAKTAKPEKVKPQVPDLPPLLNEANLVGSVWVVEPKPGIQIQVTLNAGGQATAHTDSFLVKQLAGTDTLPGSWSVDGAKLHVATTFQGKDYGTDLVIAGDQVYGDGTPISRLR